MLQERADEMISVLIVESSDEIRSALSPHEQRLDLRFYNAITLEQTRNLLRNLRPEVTIAMRELPDGDGLDLVSKGLIVPNRAIMISYLNDAEDRVQALKIGTEDYLGRPFNAEELYLRLRRILQRTREAKGVIYSLGELRIDLSTRALLDPDGKSGPELTGSEFAILRLLAENVGQVVERNTIYTLMSGGKTLEDTSRAVDSCVSRLRNKLKWLDSGIHIHSLRQVGFLLEIGRVL